MPVNIPLDAYAGQPVQFRFLYRTDGAVAPDGFFADEVVVSADGVPIVTSGAEDGDEGWALDGFAATTGTETGEFNNYYIASNRTYTSGTPWVIGNAPVPSVAWLGGVFDGVAPTMAALCNGVRPPVFGDTPPRTRVRGRPDLPPGPGLQSLPAASAATRPLRSSAAESTDPPGWAHRRRSRTPRRSSAPSARLQNTGTVPAEEPNEKKITLPKNSFNRSSSRKENAIAAFAARF